MWSSCMSLFNPPAFLFIIHPEPFIDCSTSRLCNSESMLHIFFKIASVFNPIVRVDSFAIHHSIVSLTTIIIDWILFVCLRPDPKILLIELWNLRIIRTEFISPCRVLLKRFLIVHIKILDLYFLFLTWRILVFSFQLVAFKWEIKLFLSKQLTFRLIMLDKTCIFDCLLQVFNQNKHFICKIKEAVLWVQLFKLFLDLRRSHIKSCLRFYLVKIIIIVSILLNNALNHLGSNFLCH